MESPSNSAKPFQRTPFWYVKFLFACFGAALALLMLVVVVCVPFSATLTSDHARIIMLVLTVAVSPFVYRHLK